MILDILCLFSVNYKIYQHLHLNTTQSSFYSHARAWKREAFFMGYLEKSEFLYPYRQAMQ
jgi:hypothetical protein